jgi:monovalent cation/hydrogen antiporter
LRNRLKDVENRKDGNDHHKKLAELGDELELALIGAERELANTLYRTGELKDEGRRRIERELDLREAVMANLRSQE